MREIKYRAYDKKKRVMFTALSSWTVLGYEGEIYNIAYVGEQHKRFSLMQYTGLKDKNGKEIYEGDIVINYYDDNHSNIPFLVEFLVPSGPEGIICVGVSPRGKTTIYGLKNSDSERLEIIGNIYENPELIK